MSLSDHTALPDTTSAQLARAVLSLADSAGMPDTYWASDSRVALAREVLGVPHDGRYSHEHLWDDAARDANAS